MKHSCRLWGRYALGMILASGLLPLAAAPVAVTPSWTGRGLVTGGGTVESGTPLSLEAVPQVDWTFDHWDGVDAAVSHTNPLSVTAGSGPVPSAVFVSAPRNGRMNDGTVVQWLNQIGPFQEMKPAPADVGIAEIAAGPTSFLARRSDGTVTTWSHIYSSYGVFGDLFATPPEGLSDVISVAVGSSSAMALRANGTAVSWKQGNFKFNNPTGLWTVPPGLKPIVDIRPDGAVLDQDGTITGWNGVYPFTPAWTLPNRSTRSVVSLLSSDDTVLLADGTVVGTQAVANDYYSMVAYLDAHPDVVKMFDNSRWSARYVVRDNGTLEITGPNSLAYSNMPENLNHVVDVVLTDYYTLALRASAFGLFKGSPASMRLQVGDPLTLRPQWVSATSYQWYRDGVALPGMTGRTLKLASVQEADSGVYQQIATDGTKRFVGSETRVSVYPNRVAAIYLDGTRIVENQVTVRGSTALTLESTLGGTVFYTTDGSEPTPFSPQYTAPVTLSHSSTIRALAFSSNFSSSGQSQTLQVSVIPAFVVTTSVTGSGSVNGVLSGVKVDGGTTLTLTAVPGSGWKFDHWEGAVTGTSATASLTVNADASVKAVFLVIPPPAQYVVELATDGGGVARLSAGVSGGDFGKGASVTYTEGTTYTMTAIPDAGWSLIRWTGAYTGTDSPVTRVATGSASSTAVFGTTVATSAVGGGHVTLDPDLPVYPFGTRVHVVPVPDAGKVLAAWGGSGSGNPATDWYLTVTGAPPSISALFAAAPPRLTQTILVTPVPDQKFGTPSVALSATASSGLPVSFSVVSGPGQLIGSALGLSGVGTIVVRADQAGNSQYEPASTTFSVVVGRATQSITVTPIPEQKVGAPSVALSATASSGLPVSFSVVSGPGQIIGEALLLGGAGTIVVRAEQAGNGQYEPATATVSVVVSVARTPQTITVTPVPDQTFGTPSVALSATASSGLPVSFSVVSGPGQMLGSALGITGVGTIVVRAEQSGNNQFEAASTTFSVVVGRATQSLTVVPIADQKVGGNPVQLSATASSGMPVTFTVVSGPGQLNGSTLSFNGAGTIVVRADQAGDSRYEAASATLSVVVNPATQTITFDPPASLTYFPSVALALEATASSGQAVSFKIESGPGVLIANILSIQGSGTIVITASAGATAVYPAASVTRSIVVNPAPKAQTIRFDEIADQVLGGAPLVLSATATSELGVTFSVVDGPAVVEGTSIRFTGVGVVHVAADQAGNGTYAAAPRVVRAVQVVPGLVATFNPAGNPDSNRLSIILDNGVQADVEESTDLGNWITLGTVQGRGTGQPVSFTLGGGTATSRFWRLRVRP